jgi:valacyclovir hydrolase
VPTAPRIHDLDLSPMLSLTCRSPTAALRRFATVRGQRLLSDTATSGTVAVNGVNIFYRREGTSGLPLLCMPGAMGTAETDFAPQLRDLSDAMQVVSYDPRGYGQSRPPERDFPLDFYQRDADDAAAVMKALGHDRFAVMGWSDGAISAVKLAATHAASVEKLVIFGGNAYLTKEDIDAFEATRDVEANWSKRMKESLYPLYGKEGLQRMWSSAVDAWAGIYAANDGDVCMEDARSIKCPTLVLHGAKDPICLSEHPEWFAKNIPVCASAHEQSRRAESGAVRGGRMGARETRVVCSLISICSSPVCAHTPQGDGATQLEILPEGKHNLHLRYADEVNAMVRKFIL